MKQLKSKEMFIAHVLMDVKIDSIKYFFTFVLQFFYPCKIIETNL